MLFNYVSCLCFFLVVSFLVFFIFVHVFVLCACITKRVRLFEFKVMCLCLDCSCVLHPLSSSSLCIRIVFSDHSRIQSRHLSYLLLRQPVTSSSILFFSIFSCVVCLCFIFLCFLFVLFNYVSCLCFFLVESFLVFFICVLVLFVCVLCLYYQTNTNYCD